MAAIRAVFLLTGAALGVFYPFVTVLLSDRGLPPGAIGLVTGASALAFTIALPVWSHLADVSLGRRRALVVASVGASVFVLGAGQPLPIIVVGACFIAFSACECSWGPLSDALAVNAVRDQAREYGRIRLLASVGFAVAATLTGFLYDRTGYQPAYLLFFVLALCLAGTAVFAPDIARADLAAITRAAGGQATGRPGGSFGVALRAQPRLRGVMAAILLAHVGIIAGFTFLPLRIVELGGQPSDVALSASVSAFAEVPAIAVAGALAGRLGLRGLFAVLAATYAVCFLSWTVIDSPALIIASRAVSGLAFGGMWVAAVLTMSILLPPPLQATGQGLYQVTAFGAAAVLANAVGGLVFESLGGAVLFGGSAVLAALAAGAALAWLPRRGEVPMPELQAALEAPVPLVPTATG